MSDLFYELKQNLQLPTMAELTDPVEYMRFFLKKNKLNVNPQGQLSSGTIREYIGQAWLEQHKEAKKMSDPKTNNVIEKFSRDKIGAAIELLIKESRTDYNNRLREDLKFEGHGSTHNIDLFISALCGENSKPTDKIALMHWLWLVKRNLWEMRTIDHLMITFFNKKHGNGKTTSIINLISPFKYATTSRDIDDLIDERGMHLLASNLIIFSDELGGASKAEVEKIKRVITAENLSARILFTNVVEQFRNKASFIAASNRSIDEFIRDDDMRRFYQINTADVINWEIINNIDYISLWREVDENKECGYFSEHREQMRKVQKELSTSSPFDLFIEEKLLTPLDVTKTVEINSDAIYFEFKEFCADFKYTLMSANSFHKKTSRIFGKRRTNSATFVQVNADHRLNKMRLKMTEGRYEGQ